jgi:hypothetical protein
MNSVLKHDHSADLLILMLLLLLIMIMIMNMMISMMMMMRRKMMLGRSRLLLTPTNAAHCASARQSALRMRNQRAVIQQ